MKRVWKYIAIFAFGFALPVFATALGVESGGYEFIPALNITGNQTPALKFSYNGGTAFIAGGISASVNTASIPAVTVYPTNTLNANGAIFGVANSTSTTEVFVVDYEGDLTLPLGNITTGGSIGITISGGGDLLVNGGQIKNTVASQPVAVNDAEGLGLVGVAAASFATCNNSVPPLGTRGTIQYATDNKAFYYCDGTSWIGIFGAPANWSYSTENFDAYTGALNAEEQDFGQQTIVNVASSVVAVNIDFTITTVGVVGAGTAILQVLDYDNTVLCTLDFACNTAVGTTIHGDDGGGTECTAHPAGGGNAVHANWDTTSGCTTLPLGNLSFSSTSTAYY